jgi:hypothetical protein
VFSPFLTVLAELDFLAKCDYRQGQRRVTVFFYQEIPMNKGLFVHSVPKTA